MRRPKGNREPLGDVAPERALAFYGGYALMAVGLCLFVSVFFLGMGSQPEPSPSLMPGFPGMMQGDVFAESRRRAEETRSTGQAGIVRAFLGMGLVAAGAILNGIGRQGVAGSGFSPSPSAVQEDLEPWARAEGGLLGAKLDAAGFRQQSPDPMPSEPEIRVRCLRCGALNEESDRFCGACGAPLIPGQGAT